MKKWLITLSTAATVTAPVAAVISCGNDESANTNTSSNKTNINIDDFAHAFRAPQRSGGSSEQAATSAGFSNLLEGTIADNAHVIEPYYGKSRPDDHLKGTNEGIEIKKRQQNGHPKTPGINVADLWNWTPEATANGKANKTQLGPDGRVKLDYTGEGTASRPYPVIDFMGGMPDLEYNRATIREVQPRMFGSQIKETQSTLARVISMNSYAPKNGDTNLGFNSGASTQELHPLASSEYVDLDIPWNPGPHFDAKIPSGERIDALHRHGVPTVGAVLFFPRATGEGERNVKIICNPGPNKDYPVAKGLVEMAQTIGFDGWWFDWEVSDPGIGGFLKALNSYSHYGYYTTEDGTIINIASKNNGTPLNTIPKADGSDLKDHYKNGKGTLRKLLTSNYWLPDTSFGYSDIFTWQQKHASDANASEINGHWRYAKANNRDRYFMNGASNAPEDSMAGCRRILGKYYWAARAANPTKGGHPIIQNQWSWWIWSFTQSSNISTQEEVWSSYAGDPRVKDGMNADGTRGDVDRFAVSNGFREHTSVIGNKDFETSFSYGNGKSFNLWGSPDVHRSVIGTNDKGWTSFLMTDVLPTYKWMVDFYDTNGRDVTDLSVGANGKLANRPVTPFINNETKNAYMGGATLDYKGSLGVGSSLVNKLYASNIPVKENDKFTIKIRNNWAKESERMIPELALWTSSTQPEYKMYNDDGTLNTNAFYKSDGTEVDPLDSNNHLGWAGKSEDPSDQNSYTGKNDPISDLWRYQKDTRANVNTDEGYLAASNVKDLNNGWLEVTYDLTSINANQYTAKTGSGKTTLKDNYILDFGLKLTGKKDAANVNNVSIGELKFDAAADTTKEIKEFRNLVTKKVWNNKGLKYQKARIAWQTIGMDGNEYDPSEIKEYMVFYKDSKGTRTGLAWMGANPVAYLDDISKAETEQHIEIVAVDYNNEIIFQQDAKVKL